MEAESMKLKNPMLVVTVISTLLYGLYHLTLRSAYQEIKL